MALTMSCSECGQQMEAADEEALREKFTLHMAESHPGVQLAEEEINELVAESQSGTNLVKLGGSNATLEAPEHDTRGQEIFDDSGEDVGKVEELYVNEEEGAVRFLEVRADDSLGVGNRCFLIPVEAISRVGEDRVTLNQSRQKLMDSPESPSGEIPSPERQQDSQKYYGFGAYHTD